MGRLELKLLSILVLLAGLPLLVASRLAGHLVEQSLDVGLNPHIGAALDDAVLVFSEFVRAEKDRQRALAEGLAGSAELQQALTRGDLAQARIALGRALDRRRVFRIELWAQGAETPALRLAQPAPDPERWLLDTVEVPLPARVAPFTTLRYEYGLEARFIERFEEMESKVIADFRDLQATRDDLVAVTTWSFLASLGAAILAASLIGFIGGRRITRRLARLRQGLAAIARGELDVRVTPQGHDEIADLTQGFNQMAEQLGATQRKVEYLSKLSAWQGIARRLAHEIKNPLTPILLAVQQVQSGYRGDDDAYRRTLDTAREIVEDEVRGLRRLVESFSDFARLPTVTLQEQDLGPLVRDLVAAHPEIVGLQAVLPPHPLPWPIDRDLLRQALGNLLQNAAQATADLKDPRIILSAEPISAGVRLQVADNGPGVPQTDHERIFEPYVTGREEGTGLGLSIVKKIVLDHGGTITVSQSPGLSGALFQIDLEAVR